MPKPFDATLKDLAGIDPGQFLADIDAPQALPVCLLNVDLSTVTASADIVFGLGDPLQEIIHVDAQAGPDAYKHLDVMAYNALLHRQYRVPVHSILLLLRRQAQHSSQTGTVQYAARPPRGKMDFGYEIMRLWEKPVESLLASGLISLPLAPLCRLPEKMSLEEGMRWVLTQVVERLHREGTPELFQRLLTATFILGGLRLDRHHVLSILQGVRAMRESDTYQYILDEGRAEGLQRAVLHLGRKKLGEPDETYRRALMKLTNLDHLDRLIDRVGEVTTWQELLDTP
jgi:predicted transposase YdaD